jgi:hypothetical protein
MTTDTIIVKVKDKNKFSFLLYLLEQLGFVDIAFSAGDKTSKEKHDFFKSAGLLKSRKLDANELRQQAWQRNV